MIREARENFETLTPQIKNTSYLGYIYPLKNTPNLQFKAFGIQSEAKMHPKSRIRAIGDTFASLKPPQIFNSKHLGYNLMKKCTPNQEYELFGIHLPPQKHPKSSIQSIWDTETSKNISPPCISEQFEISAPKSGRAGNC